MPGHKRSKEFGIIGSEIDITEIEGFDNLHDAKGVLLDIENRLTAHYKAEKSFMLVNGSTVGILSAVFALCNEGDTVIAARNCHKSVYNACMLRKLRVIYLEPDYDNEYGLFLGIPQERVDEIIKMHPEAKAMIITSPTYEGFVSDIKCPIPLIIDAAHGAHFGLGYFPDYPKGDIVVSSLHKTLPALTQTAVINVYNKEYIKRVKLYLDIFETSSPSYVLMNSVDICLDYIESHKEEYKEFGAWLKSIQCIDTRNIFVLENDDCSKVIIETADSNITGKELADIFRERYNFEIEAYSRYYVTLILTIADNSMETIYKLCDVICEIDSTLEKGISSHIELPPCPENAQLISIDNSSVQTDFKGSIGKIANEFIFAYPPDIPIIVPGEIISAEIIEHLSLLFESGVNIVSDSGLFPDKILTKEA